MDFLLSYQNYITREVKEFSFTESQIYDNIEIFKHDQNDQLFEHWWNTVFDFAALIPGVGSIFEGINLVSYAKQGEYLLAGLCAIGLIPLFGQYIGAGGSLLVKGIKGGGKIGAKMLGPVGELITKYFPKITKFFKSESFLGKFPGISKYTGKMVEALKDFSMGKKTGILSKIAGTRGRYKTMTRVGEWIIPGGKGENALSTMNPKIAETGEVNWEEFMKRIPVQQ